MSQCYGMFRQKITPLKDRKPYRPTNATVPVVPCCNSDDTCLSNSICHYDTRSIVGGSGYYVAACSDPGYKDKNCRKICNTFQSRADIAYNSKSGRWHCCGADSRNNANCDNATNDVVDVPAPTLLQTYWPTSNATPTSSPQQSPLSGLSPGAAGGIGAGVGVVVLVLVGLGVFFLVRRRRRQQLGNFDPTSLHQSSAKSQYVSVSQGYQAELSSLSGANAYAYDATQPRHELLHMASPVEVARTASPQELPAGEASRATSSGI